jgi:hypothetical protein
VGVGNAFGLSEGVGDGVDTGVSAALVWPAADEVGVADPAHPDSATAAEQTTAARSGTRGLMGTPLTVARSTAT